MAGNTVTETKHLSAARFFRVRFSAHTALCTTELELSNCQNDSLLVEIGRHEYDLLQERARILARLEQIEGQLKSIRAS